MLVSLRRLRYWIDPNLFLSCVGDTNILLELNETKQQQKKEEKILVYFYLLS